MPNTLSVQCCIAGGGPAGMMLGLLQWQRQIYWLTHCAMGK